MPTFADVCISSLGYLRPYVLFENNGDLASEASARERARRARKKIPHHYPLALTVNKSPAVYIYHPTDLEEKVEGL